MGALRETDMKSRRQHELGFTLIELLAVMAVIAILAGFLLPAMGKAKEAALRARAQTEMQSIITAVKAYRNEYGKWPCEDNGRSDVVYTMMNRSGSREDEQKKVIRILRGLDDDNNPRKILFLEVPDKSFEGQDMEGNEYDFDDGFFLDPWQNPYVIVLDTDFDNRCTIPNSVSSPVEGTNIVARTVCVASWGQDPSNEKSFLLSWE